MWQCTRREFITLLGGAAAWPLAARAQQGERMRRIAVLMPFGEDDPDAQVNMSAFRQALQTLGWNDGRNVQIDYRWGRGDAERIKLHATDLVGRRPDAILVSSALVLQAVQHETHSTPIVFAQMSDPVASGFVESLARPGGNITGFTTSEFSLWGKLLEVLKEAAPRVVRAAVLFNPEQTPQAGMWRAIEDVAPSVGVQLTSAGVRNAAEIEHAIEAFGRERNGGLIVLPSPPTIVHRALIVSLAARYELPAVYAFRHFVGEGGLMSYGISLPDQYRQAASYVNRILRGERPADLPIQQPTKFELVINLKTAMALGLEIPTSVLARADEVIE
jgi:putative tryptophan/tyrosine transport system substrate-binding protein